MIHKSRVVVKVYKTHIIIDRNRMDIYSARNSITKGTDLYSVLNPLTSSDSPSLKSKGERFDSASKTTKKTNILNIKIQRGLGKVLKEKLTKIIHCSRRNNIQTS